MTSDNNERKAPFFLREVTVVFQQEALTTPLNINKTPPEQSDDNAAQILPRFARWIYQSEL